MTNSSDSSISITPKTARIAGLVLLTASILIIFTMAHHPQEIESGDTGVGMTLGGIVHASMVFLLGANFWGLAVFSVRRALTGWMLAGILAYGVSVLGNVIAGMINGFVVPALAAEVDRTQSGDLFILLWESNQAAAQLGIYAASAAFFFWSLALIQRRGAAGVFVGLLGLLAATVPSLALYTGLISLDVDGAFLAYGVQSAWTGLLGLHMIFQHRTTEISKAD